MKEKVFVMKTKEELEKIGLADRTYFYYNNGPDKTPFLGRHCMFEKTAIGKRVKLRDIQHTDMGMVVDVKCVTDEVWLSVPLEYIFDPEDYPEYFV
jgi:hypothetical protein